MKDVNEITLLIVRQIKLLCSTIFEEYYDNPTKTKKIWVNIIADLKILHRELSEKVFLALIEEVGNSVNHISYQNRQKYLVYAKNITVVENPSDLTMFDTGESYEFFVKEKLQNG